MGDLPRPSHRKVGRLAGTDLSGQQESNTRESHERLPSAMARCIAPEMVRLLGDSLLTIKMMTVLEDAQCCLGPAERVGGNCASAQGAGINTMRNLGGWDVLTDPLSSNWILRGTRFSVIERFLVDG